MLYFVYKHIILILYIYIKLYHVKYNNLKLYRRVYVVCNSIILYNILQYYQAYYVPMRIKFVLQL